jgi:hypothetical protein
MPDSADDQRDTPRHDVGARAEPDAIGLPILEAVKVGGTWTVPREGAAAQPQSAPSSPALSRRPWVRRAWITGAALALLLVALAVGHALLGGGAAVPNPPALVLRPGVTTAVPEVTATKPGGAPGQAAPARGPGATPTPAPGSSPSAAPAATGPSAVPSQPGAASPTPTPAPSATHQPSPQPTSTILSVTPIPEPTRQPSPIAVNGRR